nr:hypothetical protein [Mesorhizobium sp.]
MKTLRTTSDRRQVPLPPFGHPGCVDPCAIPRMAPHLQREAVLLLMEMGRNALSVAQASGLGPMEVMHILDGKRPLFEIDLPGFGEAQ